MFEKILIVYSEKLTNKHLETVEKVKRRVDGKKCTIVKSKELTDAHFKDIDLVITVGGDGAFIRAASFIDKQPILGINSEPEFSEGALLSLKEEELEKLDEILHGKFKISEKERIEVKLNGKEINKLALNEIYFGSLLQFHTSRYVIKFQNKKEEQRSSGVLIATSSGSTAWYKSTGGLPFKENKLKFIVREPFLSRVFKPKILYGVIDKKEKIELESKRHDRSVVAIDSDRIYDLNYGDKVEIELSDKPLKVIIG